jgi:hypothetical protein
MLFNDCVVVEEVVGKRNRVPICYLWAVLGPEGGTTAPEVLPVPSEIRSSQSRGLDPTPQTYDFL